ncbi:MAG: glycosyltransferase family 2 protein [Opitutaceae bacterium]|nr:glycosyltransferase family 2 protein [Opitutaceae bacterium]
MNSPRISIIAPNFNHGRFLPAMIDSCLEQSFQDWELIVIDDASTDNSVEIVDEYVRRHRNIRLIRNQVNQGPIRSVNRGFAVASGDYVVMRSADDINLPGYFQTAVALLEEYPQAAFFCGDIAYFREDPTVRQVETLGIGPTPGYYSPEVLIDRLGALLFTATPVLIRRELLVEVGYYRESHRWYNDWLPNMAWAFRKGVCYSPIPMMGCRLLSDSFGNKGGSTRP